MYTASTGGGNKHEHASATSLTLAFIS